MVTNELFIHAEIELQEVAEKLLAFCGKRKKIVLYGQLGAGKTALVKAICRLLNTLETANSPTFSIINEYEYPKGIVYHIDLYRLKNIAEAIDIGIEDYLYDENYCFVEWAEIIEQILPESVVFVQLERIDDNGRKIVFWAN